MLDLTQSRDGEDQLAGSNLTFTIDISVDSNMDSPHTVSVNWTRDGIILTNGERITLSNVSNVNGSNLYQAQLMFSTLSSTMDSGMYASIISINSISPNPYIIDTLPTTEILDINVNGKHLLMLLSSYYCNATCSQEFAYICKG